MPEPTNFEDALYAILSGAAAVAADVSDQIYPERAPDGVTGRYIVYTLIHDESDQTHESASSLTRARYQLDCYAPTAAAAKNLAKKARAELHGYQGTIAGVRVDYVNASSGPGEFSDLTKRYRRSVEIDVLFAEP